MTLCLSTSSLPSPSPAQPPEESNTAPWQPRNFQAQWSPLQAPSHLQVGDIRWKTHVQVMPPEFPAPREGGSLGFQMFQFLKDYLRKNVKTALSWWFTRPLGCTWWMQGSCRRLRRATRAASFTFGWGSPHAISRSRWGTWHCSSSSPRPSGPRLPRADTALRRIPAWGSSSNWVIPGTAAARAGPRGPAW